ncbi:MAG: DUF3053 family protein [Pseudolabrys sp.]|nr:DUF3053 family protein [Pseudolabrys sp.]
MVAVTRRIAGIAALAMFAVALAGCGDKEPEQRKAFIAFLQSRILDKQGARVPKPSEAEIKSFGVYAEHYAVIAGFNAEIDAAMAGPYRLSESMAPRSLQELLERRQDVAVMRDSLSKSIDLVRNTLSATQMRREALRQPDDLRPVYTAAYDRSVTAPALAFLATVPVAIDGLTQSLKFAEYLDSNRSTVKVSGSNIDAKNARARADVNRMMSELNGHRQKLTEARQRMRIVFEGK